MSLNLGPCISTKPFSHAELRRFTVDLSKGELTQLASFLAHSLLTDLREEDAQPALEIRQNPDAQGDRASLKSLRSKPPTLPNANRVPPNLELEMKKATSSQISGNVVTVTVSIAKLLLLHLLLLLLCCCYCDCY